MNKDWHMTHKEWELFQNQEFMPVKQQVYGKLEGMLAEVKRRIEVEVHEASQLLPQEMLQSTGKLSRGENYFSFAYRVMDYPRIFSGPDMFLFRCMVLWGHYLGFFVMLKGVYQQKWGANLYPLTHHTENGAFIYTGADPWTWWQKDPHWVSLVEFGPTHYQRLIGEHPFLKLGIFYPLVEYVHLPMHASTLWRKVQQLLFNESDNIEKQS